MLRAADPGAVLPGVDTAVGNPLAAGSLIPASQITRSSSAPFWYDAVNNRVVVTQAGAVLSGINFGSATVFIEANNVTVKDCTFQAGGKEWYCIIQGTSCSGAVIEQNTFTGGSAANPLPLAAFITSTTKISVLGNSFVNAPSDAVDLQNGVVSGNYFSGAGFSSNGLHPDAIWVGATTGPVTISNNFIDETYAAGATGVNNGMANSAVRITSESGNTSNVSVTGNVLLGGTYTVDPGIGGTGTFSNINVSRNFIGFGQYGALYPGAAPATTESGNVIFDFTNPAYSAQAWAAYRAAGVPTAHLIVSSGGTIVAGSGSTTLYGAGARVHLFGGVGENNFVGGFGTQYLFGGPGANIFTELAISDSPVTGQDDIAYFDSRQGRHRPQPYRLQSDDPGRAEFHLHRNGRLQRRRRPGPLPAGPGAQRHLCPGRACRRTPRPTSSSGSAACRRSPPATSP